jgi:hypothetical protein
MWRRLFASIVLLGCGANVVFDEPGSGGNGAGGNPVTDGGSNPTTNTTSTGTGPCVSHDECAPGVCIFSTGICAPACTGLACESCGPNAFCEPCATSSCPKCNDCRAACVELGPGRCDDDDPCPAPDVCMFPEGVCYPPCGANGECDDFSFCDGCATGSCCTCKNCVGACIGGE